MKLDAAEQFLARLEADTEYQEARLRVRQWFREQVTMSKEPVVNPGRSHRVVNPNSAIFGQQHIPAKRAPKLWNEAGA